MRLIKFYKKKLRKRMMIFKKMSKDSLLLVDIINGYDSDPDHITTQEEIIDVTNNTLLNSIYLDENKLISKIHSVDDVDVFLSIKNILLSCAYFGYDDRIKSIKKNLISKLETVLNLEIQDFFSSHIESGREVDFIGLSYNNNISEEFFDEHLHLFPTTNPDFCSGNPQCFWHYVCQNDNVSDSFFEKHIENKNITSEEHFWRYICENKYLSESFFLRYRHVWEKYYISWCRISRNSRISESFFRNNIDNSQLFNDSWEYNPNLSLEFIDECVVPKGKKIEWFRFMYKKNDTMLQKCRSRMSKKDYIICLSQTTRDSKLYEELIYNKEYGQILDYFFEYIQNINMIEEYLTICPSIMIYLVQNKYMNGSFFLKHYNKIDFSDGCLFKNVWVGESFFETILFDDGYKSFTLNDFKKKSSKILYNTPYITLLCKNNSLSEHFFQKLMDHGVELDWNAISLNNSYKISESFRWKHLNNICTVNCQNSLCENDNLSPDFIQCVFLYFERKNYPPSLYYNRFNAYKKRMLFNTLTKHFQQIKGIHKGLYDNN